MVGFEKPINVGKTLYSSYPGANDSQPGGPYKYLIAEEIASDDEALLDAICDNIPNASHRDISKGAEPFYDETQNYESIEAAAPRRSRDEEAEYWYEAEVSYQRRDFCEDVQTRNCFFNLKERLDQFFGIPLIYQLAIGTISLELEF